MLFGGALAGPALALPITCLLIAVAALVAPGAGLGSPAGSRRAAIRNALGGLAPPKPDARAAVALVALGIGLGIPLALGLMPGNAIALVGAFGACTAGHCLLGGAAGARGDHVVESPVAWFALLSFCVLASALRFSTLDLRTALAAQAAIGPGALGGPLLFSAVDVLGGLVGLMAGAAWVEHLPRLAGSPQAEALDTALRWGESALVAAAVTAQVWGPSVGALLHGPWRVLVGPVAVSTLVTLAAVALVSILRSKFGAFPARALLGTLAPVALVALLAARLG
ncbi:MAG: hypothetical protein QOD49_1193 [Actinomycetota bacterium]|nr:hypothetical protein [Actinomycetota bacterium]